jgi:hypothetical protein
MAINEETYTVGGPVALPATGQKATFFDTDGTFKAVDSSGNKASGGSGAGWFGKTAIPFVEQSLSSVGGSNSILTFDGMVSEVQVGGGVPPTRLTSVDGGVYQFAGAGLLSALGSLVNLASPTATSWAAVSRNQVVDAPGGSDVQCWLGMNDGTGSGNNTVAIEINGPGSTTVGNIRFTKATVTTRTALNSVGTINSGIVLGQWVTLALVFVGGVVSAYVNGVFAGSRSDLASAGPTVGLMPWFETTAGTNRWWLDKFLFATTGP